jgi:hypothetical protein
MRDEDDALFSGRGPLPEDLARLERALSKLPLPPEPDWNARSSREQWPRYVYAAVAAVLLMAFAATLLMRDAWSVHTIEGSPSLGGMAFVGRIGMGGRVITDRHSRARIEVKGLGAVELEPGSELRRVRGHGGERRLQLDHGTLYASIQAPPRQFVVETPVGVATDLGCAYWLSVDRSGNGRLKVTTGRVVFTRDGLESFVPAGVWCPLLRTGAGVPRRDYASDAFLIAMNDWDQVPASPAFLLERVLSTAEPSDAITLWHLLPRVDETARARVAARIAALIEVPADVSRERVLALEPAALDAWWGAIGMGPASEWRATSPKQALP